MEINHTEAITILQAHKIEISDLDPRSATEIASQFIMTGQVALGAVVEKQMDSVARIQAEIAWPKCAQVPSRVGSLPRS